MVDARDAGEHARLSDFAFLFFTILFDDRLSVLSRRRLGVSFIF